MSLTTKQKGNIAQLAVAADLAHRGYTVAQPFGDHGDWDLLIERNNGFERIQVKYASTKEGYIPVRNRCHSVVAGRVQRTHSYNNSVEWIAVYAADHNFVCYVSATELGKEEMRLRVTKPKNNQVAGIRWANDYLNKIDDPVWSSGQGCSPVTREVTDSNSVAGTNKVHDKAG